jgi:hypothetical protein
VNWIRLMNQPQGATPWLERVPGFQPGASALRLMDVARKL